jgi:hypothetical protein
MAKSNPKKEWQEFPLEGYQQEASKLVHFSGKTVNSNVPACGVRLGPESALDFPVVGVRTLLADGVIVPLDYTQNAGKTATFVKQMRLAVSGEAPETVPTDQVQAIRRVATEATVSAYEEGTDWVSPRLRQLLLPKGTGAYVAVTPLGSSGLSALLNQKLTAQPEFGKRFKHALLGMGGSNPQNVGALVREMRNPLLFRSPVDDPQARRVLSIHFKGISLGLPCRKLDAYRQWYELLLRQNNGDMPSTMDIRQEEAMLIGDLAHAVKKRGQQARELLEAHRDLLPLTPNATSLLSPEFKDDVVRGLIEPDSRDAHWSHDFGLKIARAIEAELRTKWDRPLLGSAVSQIAGWIEDAIR